MAKPQKYVSPNKSIHKYLADYCDPKKKFGYAVLIRGAWGSGKTHLINEFLEKRKKENQKYLYVTLYGVNSLAQIDDALHRQTNPILTSKEVALAWRVIKGLVKVKTGVDLNKDGDDDLTVEASVPDVDLKDFASVPEETLLVFDDLERCSKDIDISDVLGYINSFVEHKRFKVVLVANEEEITKREDEQYERVKEKLVGQTLTVVSEVDLALNSFLSLITNRKAKQFLREHSQEIRLLHDQSQTNNLRLLKYALWDFERMARCFAENHWANSAAVQRMLALVVSLSFEVRGGKLKEDEIGPLKTSYLTRLTRAKNPNAKPTILDEISVRYPEVNFSQSLIAAETLKSLLFDGWVDPDSVRQALDQNPDYATPRTLPPWKVAWHGWQISDGEFNEAVTKVEDQFSKLEFRQPSVMLHVFGLRLFFSEIGAIAITRSQVELECKNYIDEVRSSGVFPDPFVNPRPGELFGIEGLQVFESDSAEFKSILGHYDAVAAVVANELLPQKAAEILAVLRTDPIKYFRLLSLNSAEMSPYHEIPVLAVIPPEQFVDQVLSLPIDSQNTVFSAFKARYERGALERELKAEADWLDKIKKVFAERMKAMGPMSRFRLKNRIGHNIDTALVALTAKS